MATTFNSVDPRTGETGPAYEEARSNVDGELTREPVPARAA